MARSNPKAPFARMFFMDIYGGRQTLYRRTGGSTWARSLGEILDQFYLLTPQITNCWKQFLNLMLHVFLHILTFVFLSFPFFLCGFFWWGVFCMSVWGKWVSVVPRLPLSSQASGGEPKACVSQRTAVIRSSNRVTVAVMGQRNLPASASLVAGTTGVHLSSWLILASVDLGSGLHYCKPEYSHDRAQTTSIYAH